MQASPIRPQKKLGQNFLQDTTTAQKIVATLTNTHTYQAILEVGPGTGALTRWLIDTVQAPLYLVEIDPILTTHLQKTYPNLKEKIIQKDFLQLHLEKTLPSPIALIGNFPYNISSQIFFKILTAHKQIGQVVCMIQKEVAERIVSPPGNKTYGLLSVLLQTYYKTTYSFTVPPSAFIPKPKVTSAVIHLQRNTTKHLDCDEKLFFRVVKAGFGQRRKMLRNALRTLRIPLQHLPTTLLNKRAEALHVADFVAITQALSKTT